MEPSPRVGTVPSSLAHQNDSNLLSSLVENVVLRRCSAPCLLLEGMRGGRISGWKHSERRVIDGRPSRYDTGFRNRDDEAAATFAISRLLSHHLAREIPSE